MTNTEQRKTGTLAQEGQEQEAQVMRRINQGTVGAGSGSHFRELGQARVLGDRSKVILIYFVLDY